MRLYRSRDALLPWHTPSNETPNTRLRNPALSALPALFPAPAGPSSPADEPLHKTRSLGILQYITATRAAQRFKNDIEDPQMDCPKCNAPMEEATYGRNMTIDRCTGCQGIWFDLGEAEQLKDK